MESPPVVEMIGIDKSFPGVNALQRVNFRLFPGEIHALMGQNGAGKSTLINVLTGVHAHDAGEIRVGGAPVHFAAPREAEAAGIQTLYQEVNLCANLSVAENIFAGRQPMRRGAIDWNTIHARAALAELDLALDVTRSLDAYPIAVQQMVAIARAVSVDARVLILDEPTSSLDDGEVARLFDVLRRLKASGIAILFVTHFLEQTYAVSDRITVMRNGEREGEYLARDLPVDVLVAKMTGRERMSDTLQAGAAAVERTAGEADPFLSMQQVGRRGMMASLDLDVRPGEIVGLAGLLGSGRTETAQLAFAAERADTGAIEIDGARARLASPHDAVRNGIAYCPEDRKKGGHRRRTVDPREHHSRAAAARLVAADRAGARELADTYIARLGIKARDAEQPIGLLSGGNQQGAARALARDGTEAADSRRADARHRRRREIRHHGARARAGAQLRDPVHLV